VDRLDELVVAADGERLAIGNRLLEVRGQLVHAHEKALLESGWLVT
jgi:hypothetical protein